MQFTLSHEDIQLINVLEKQTGALAIDVVQEPDEIIFIVKKGELGKAIGKQGTNAARLRLSLGKNVEIIETSEDPKVFLKNTLYPAEIKSIDDSERNGKKMLVINVDEANKGKVIGKNGDKINRSRRLMKRHFGLEEIKVL